MGICKDFNGFGAFVGCLSDRNMKERAQEAKKPDEPFVLLMETLIAKEAAARLRVAVRVIEDRDTARQIHAELVQITKTLQRKHKFTKGKSLCVVKS